MRGEDALRAGRLEDLRGAVGALAHVPDVVVGQPVLDDRVAVLADPHLAAVAIAQQHADRDRVGQRLHDPGVVAARRATGRT